MWNEFKGWFRHKMGISDTAPNFEGHTILIKNDHYRLGRLSTTDINAVLDVEKSVYGDEIPWDRPAFIHELKKQHDTLYVGAFDTMTDQLTAFIGCWFSVNEAHVTNLAVRDNYQRKGLATALMELMISYAIELNCQEVTLEVRVDNYAAKNLYHKFGFRDGNIKKGYYTQTHTDALDMILDINRKDQKIDAR